MQGKKAAHSLPSGLAKQKGKNIENLEQRWGRVGDSGRKRLTERQAKTLNCRREVSPPQTDGTEGIGAREDPIDERDNLGKKRGRSSLQKEKNRLIRFHSRLLVEGGYDRNNKQRLA